MENKKKTGFNLHAVARIKDIKPKDTSIGVVTKFQLYTARKDKKSNEWLFTNKYCTYFGALGNIQEKQLVEATGYEVDNKHEGKVYHEFIVKDIKLAETDSSKIEHAEDSDLIPF